ATDTLLESDRYRLSIDPESGAIARLYDKARGLQVFGDLAARPLLFRDHGNAWGAHRYDVSIDDAIFRPVRILRTQHGPLMAAIQAKYVLERDGAPTGSTLMQEFRL